MASGPFPEWKRLTRVRNRFPSHAAPPALRSHAAHVVRPAHVVRATLARVDVVDKIKFHFYSKYRVEAEEAGSEADRRARAAARARWSAGAQLRRRRRQCAR
jgi:hypothetical protein